MIKRGEVFYANLSPVVGSEQGGNRPAIVIGKNSRSNKTILVVPLGSFDKTKGLKTGAIISTISLISTIYLYIKKKLR